MKVYVLHIAHRHGDNLSVHETDVGANEALLAYCEEWWERECRGETKPDEPGDVISRYFERAIDESAHVEECEVQP